MTRVTCGAPEPTDGDVSVRGRYWIRTYGCQMNVHDSEIYAGKLRRLGLAPADRPEDADVVLVNTCSVREKAEEKLFSELGRLRSLKDAHAPPGADAGRGRPGVRIGVTGCIAQQRAEQIIDREGSVDFVLGTRALTALPDVLEALERGEGAQVITDDLVDFDSTGAERSDRVKAFVTIMEGCNNYCSFCIVPSTRGLEIYRPARDILDEVKGLSLRGYREVTLLGQNVNSWRDEEAGLDFPGLLMALQAALDAMGPARHGHGGVERIRFLTSHPKDLSPDLIRALAACPRLAEHVHLPVQCGSDRVLRAMNRHYTVAEYLGLVDALRRSVPHVGLSTDLIVGFPGETEGEFQGTLELVRQARFDSFFSFEYSPRPGTAATRHDDDVPPEVKRRRLLELQELGKEIQRSRHAAWAGRTVPVLVDGLSRRSEDDVTGRTPSNHVVNFPGPARWIGHVVDVEVVDHSVHSLYGRAVGEPS